MRTFEKSHKLDYVCYDIRGPVMDEAQRMAAQGMEILKYCNYKLDTVEKKMLQMNEDGSLGEFSR